MKKTVRVCGPARWAHDAALADVEKLLAALHEDLPRVVSDLKNAAKMKKKICVEKRGPGWRSVVRGWRRKLIAHGPYRATQDAANQDVRMAQKAHKYFYSDDEDEDEAVVSMSPETAQFMQAALKNFFVVIGPGEELASDDETVEVQVITTMALSIEEEAKPSPEATWPEKPKEEKASDDAPPKKKVRPVAVALAEAEAQTEKKRAAAPDATWPEEPKKKKRAESFFLEAMFEALEEAEAPKEDKPAVEAPSSGEAKAAPEATWPEKPEEENATEEVSPEKKARPLAEAEAEPPKEEKPPPACSICWPPTSSRENGSSIVPQAQQGRLSTAGLDVSSRKTRVTRSWKDHGSFATLQNRPAEEMSIWRKVCEQPRRRNFPFLLAAILQWIRQRLQRKSGVYRIGKDRQLLSGHQGSAPGE